MQRCVSGLMSQEGVLHV